jgi:hypothetical protein
MALLLLLRQWTAPILEQQYQAKYADPGAQKQFSDHPAQPWSQGGLYC